MVNLLGERLGFNVSYGIHKFGYDGLWKHDNLSIIVESKTSTKTYHGALDETLKFVNLEKANCGLVVSAEFNDETINAVAGLKYSDKLRLLTTDALCKLASLKADGVLETENVKDILIPQESHLLDNVIDLIYGIREAVVKPKAEAVEISAEEQDRLSQVPKEIEDYSDDLRAMYIILKENPNTWYDPSDLAEEIKSKFPKTFVQKTEGQIAFTFPYGGMWLEKKGLLEIKKDKYGRRSYKFKKQSK